MNYKFPKQEKLKQKNDISLLFEKGKWKTCGNLRIIYIKNEEIPYPKIGVSVSKKFFKRAVHRNRIKRLLRESYRFHKTEYQEAFGPNSHAMIFWASKELPQNFQQVETEFLNLCQSKK